MGMRAIALWLLVLAVFPRVDDPWPDTIDLEFPFAMAAAGAVFAGVVCFLAGEEKRERAIKLGGLVGFSGGSAFYVISLLAQVVFGS